MLSQQGVAFFFWEVRFNDNDKQLVLDWLTTRVRPIIR